MCRGGAGRRYEKQVRDYEMHHERSANFIAVVL